jgi:hypothetical protein
MGIPLAFFLTMSQKTASKFVYLPPILNESKIKFRTVTEMCVKISKHFTSGASFISFKQQTANVLETHLPRYLSSIVVISG